MNGVLLRRGRTETERGRTPYGHKSRDGGTVAAGQGTSCIAGRHEKLRTGKKELLIGSRGKVSLMSPWFSTSGIQNCEAVSLCYFSHLVCGALCWGSRKPIQKGLRHLRTKFYSLIIRKINYFHTTTNWLLMILQLMMSFIYLRYYSLGVNNVPILSWFKKISYRGAWVA